MTQPNTQNVIRQPRNARSFSKFLPSFFSVQFLCIVYMRWRLRITCWVGLLRGHARKQVLGAWLMQWSPSKARTFGNMITACCCCCCWRRQIDANWQVFLTTVTGTDTLHVWLSAKEMRSQLRSKHRYYWQLKLRERNRRVTFKKHLHQPLLLALPGHER